MPRAAWERHAADGVQFRILMPAQSQGHSSAMILPFSELSNVKLSNYQPWPVSEGSPQQHPRDDRKRFLSCSAFALAVQMKSKPPSCRTAPIIETFVPFASTHCRTNFQGVHVTNLLIRPRPNNCVECREICCSSDKSPEVDDERTRSHAFGIIIPLVKKVQIGAGLYQY